MQGESVFVFIPNIVGYFRIALTFASCYLMPTHPLSAAGCFVMSNIVLDEVDGRAARYFKQATKFGGLFDVVIDRCTTMVLLMYLCHIYHQYAFIIQVVGFLDIFRNWMKVYSSAISRERNHKSSLGNPLLQLYYTDLCLYIFSHGVEIFYISLYLMYHSPGPLISLLGYEIGLWQIIAALTFPLAVIKQFFSLFILKMACQAIAAVDLKEREEKRNR